MKKDARTKKYILSVLKSQNYFFENSQLFSSLFGLKKRNLSGLLTFNGNCE